MSEEVLIHGLFALLGLFIVFFPKPIMQLQYRIDGYPAESKRIRPNFVRAIGLVFLFINILIYF